MSRSPYILKQNVCVHRARRRLHRREDDFNPTVPSVPHFYRVADPRPQGRESSKLTFVSLFCFFAFCLAFLLFCFSYLTAPPPPLINRDHDSRPGPAAPRATACRPCPLAWAARRVGQAASAAAAGPLPLAPPTVVQLLIISGSGSEVLVVIA